MSKVYHDVHLQMRDLPRENYTIREGLLATPLPSPFFFVLPLLSRSLFPIFFWGLGVWVFLFCLRQPSALCRCSALSIFLIHLMNISTAEYEIDICSVRNSNCTLRVRIATFWIVEIFYDGRHCQYLIHKILENRILLKAARR